MKYNIYTDGLSVSIHMYSVGKSKFSAKCSLKSWLS